MVTYTCEICAATFTKKANYESHKARKRPCKKNPTIVKLEETLAHHNIQQPSVETTKPFLKWVGGKTQILDDVLTLFPTIIHNYYEPFVGGGSVLLGFLSLLKANKISLTGKVYASDLNPHLIGVYKNIQSNSDAFIAELKQLTDVFNNLKGEVINRNPLTIDEAKTSQESYYYWIRKLFNSVPKEHYGDVNVSAMFLFLNKTCFRGVFRTGPHGFNVPFGHYKNPSIYDEQHLKSISVLLKDVEFRHCSYSDALLTPLEGDFVYLDPPYAPETVSSFVSYTTDGFDLDNHKKLFSVCSTLYTKHIKFLMSNADVKLVKDAFPSPPYSTKSISVRRAIHSKEPGTKTNEVLITWV